MIEIELEIEEIYDTVKFLFKEKTYCPDNIKITDLFILAKDYLNKIKGVISVSFSVNGQFYLIKNEKEI